MLAYGAHLMSSLQNLLILLLAGMGFAGAFLVTRLRRRHPERVLLLLGLVLRLAGSMLYLSLIGGYYGGGDYLLYFRDGSQFANSAAGLLTALDPDYWLAGRWWGTAFVSRLTGALFMVFGTSLPLAFLAFSLIGYGGIVSLWLAFRRAFPNEASERYLAWIVLFPSLWFWPAALGKDPLLLCGIGIATLGFVGRRGHTRWVPLAGGLLLVFMVRPQVAAVFAFSAVSAHWLASLSRMSLLRVVQGIALAGGAVGVAILASGALSVDLFRTDEVELYLQTRAGASNIGGSAIGSDSIRLWLAPINVLFRPFPWEVSGATGALAAAEVVGIWGLAWLNRRGIRRFIAHHRGDVLLWLAVVFIVLYATALGMSIGNVGIIARQRVHIIPFLLMFFAWHRQGREGSSTPTELR